MLDVETSEAIEEVMKETIVESNAILEAMEEAIEEHQADIEAIEAIEEALAMPCALTLLGSGLRLVSGLGFGPNSDLCGSDTGTLTLALALTLAPTLTLTRNVLPEAGRERFAESSGVKRVRVALVEPARLAPAASSGPERVELAELAVLAEMADDKTVALLQDIVSPGHAGSTCTPAQASAHGGSMPAQANQQMQMHADPALVDLAELAVLAEMAEMTSDDETVAALQGIVNSPGHGGSTCSPAQASAHACGSIPAQANQQVQMHAVPVCVELAELAPDGYTVVAPQGIVSPGHAGTGHARAPVGVPWAALADRWRRHWETKRTDLYSPSASVTTSTYSYRLELVCL